jgi:hypothetical protein
VHSPARKGEQQPDCARLLNAQTEKEAKFDDLAFSTRRRGKEATSPLRPLSPASGGEGWGVI